MAIFQTFIYKQSFGWYKIWPAILITLGPRPSIPVAFDGSSLLMKGDACSQSAEYKNMFDQQF